MLGNASGLLSQFLGTANTAEGSPQAGSQTSGGLGGLLTGKAGLATGVVAGGLAGILLGGKKPRKMATTAAKYGGAALVGGLAFKAWQNWQANKASPAQAPQADIHNTAPPAQTSSYTAPLNAPLQSPPKDTAFLPNDSAGQNELTITLIKAMVSAVKADGHVTPDELNRISSQLDNLDISQEERSFLYEELSKPVDLDALAKSANTPEVAAEIYMASILVIDRSGPAEKGYLAMLAARLALDPSLIEHLHASTANPTAAQQAASPQGEFGNLYA